MSLFNEVKKFFSAQANQNRELTTREFHNAMSEHEVSSWWKKNNNVPFYRSNTYRCYLKRLGLVKQVRHGVWEIVAPVPEWLNSGITNFLLGYHNWEKRNNTHYNGFDQDEWMSKLESHIRLYKAAQEHKLRAGIKEFMERPLEVKHQTEDSEYVYIVSTSRMSICVFDLKENAIKKAIEIICSHREMVTITKNKKGEWFYYNTCTLAGAEEVITIDARDLAREIVGDGKLNNIWFVTSGPYMLERTDHYDSEYVLLDGYTDSDSECFGPFFSYEAACAKYDDIDLDPHSGIGQVFIEDRLIGTVKEKYAEKIITVDYSFNENDDSHFYKLK